MKHLPQNKGFTLVELLIAIAVFTIVISIGIGGFVHVLHTQREIASLIVTESNASVALEQMTREIRTGFLFCHDAGVNLPNSACQYNGNPVNPYGCTPPNANNVWTCYDVLNFYNADTQNVTYSLSGGALQRYQGANGGSISGDGAYVKYLTFTIFGNKEGDHWPPRITISMGVEPSSTDPAVSGDIINLQTTVSARAIDCTGGTPAAC